MGRWSVTQKRERSPDWTALTESGIDTFHGFFNFWENPSTKFKICKIAKFKSFVLNGCSGTVHAVIYEVDNSKNRLGGGVGGSTCAAYVPAQISPSCGDLSVMFSVLLV